MVADYKMLSFYLSINEISMTLLFVALDFHPIILFQKLWNIQYFSFLNIFTFYKMLNILLNNTV